MLTIARIFAAMFFGALLLAASSVVSLADIGDHHSRVASAATEMLTADAGEEFVAGEADCDRTGMGHCCSCGQVACPMTAFACPVTFQFEVAPKIAFSVERERLLIPHDVPDLLKPPQAAII